MGTKNINEQIKKITSVFPLQFSDDIVLYVTDKGIDITYNEKEKCRKYRLDLVDNLGYRYFADYNRLMSSVGKIKNPNRFFCGNIYTYDNINNFCKINDIDLRINGVDLPITGYAREKLCCMDSNGNIHKVSWNQLQHFTFSYKNGYEEVKAENKRKRTLSKQDVINIVRDMQSKKDSPLDIYDFYPKQKDGVGIRTIRKYWGELWLMQKELDMPITGKHGSLLSDDETIHEINYICDYIKINEGRTIITYKDFVKFGTYADIRRYNEACNNLYGMTVREYLISIGFELQKEGSGMNYVFDDGEKTSSMYEYEFSKILRDYGLVYNKDYFRDYKYSKIDDDYMGNMNCDYKIIIHNNTIYVELAGILGNKGHQQSFINNTPISSKSKELYRQKLNQKREMFERNKLDYYILLPDDMNEENYRRILEKYLNKIA